MSERCESPVPLPYPVRTDKVIPCGKTPARLYTIACVHEHIRDRWACDECTALNEYVHDYCGLCYDADGHVCPVVIALATAVTP